MAQAATFYLVKGFVLLHDMVDEILWQDRASKQASLGPFFFL
jgi:hypothetical protein